LLAKYHPGIANSKTEALVNEEVNNLMQLMKVSENDLLEVEGKVRKQSNEEIAMISTNPFKRVTSYKSGAKDEWAIMNDLIVKAGFEAESRRAAARQSQKMAFKQQLDKQLEQCRLRKEAEEMERRMESGKVLTDVKSYIQAMDRRRKELEEQNGKLRLEREEEMKGLKARQEGLRAQRRLEEQEEIARNRRMQQAEHEQLRRRKEEELRKARAWRLENDNNLAEKERLRQKQVEEDLEYARKAKEVLEEKERRRQAELAVMAEKMKARERQGEALGQSAAAAAAADEERMLLVQAEMRARAEAAFQDKLRREGQKKLEVRRTLDKQMEDQERRKEEERALTRKQMELFKHQARQALQEEQRKAEARREAQVQYRLQLEDQLRHDVKIRPTKELLMSEVERRLNKSLQP